MKIIWAIPLMAIWGSSYVIIKAGLQYTSPVFFAALRALPAGLLILLLSAFRSNSMPHSHRSLRDWVMVSLLGLLCTTAFFWAMFAGTPLVGAGLAAVLVNTQPFFVAAIAYFFLSEHFGWKKVIHLLIGFSGVFLITWPKIESGFSADLFGITALLAGAFAFSVGMVLSKSLYRRLDLYWLTGWQLVIGGSVLLVLALLFEDVSSTLWTAPLLAAIGYLSIVSTAVASLIWFRLIRFYPVSVLASYGFLIPLFGIILARVFYNEKFTVWSISGMTLILVGIYGVEREQ